MRYLIEIAYAVGCVLYAIIHHPDGTVWNTVSKEWEAFDAGHWGSYVISLTEQGATGYYSAAYPPEIEDILTTEAVYNQADPGGSPSPVNDGPPLGLAQSQGVDIAAVFGDATVATKLKTSLNTMVRAVVAAGTLEVDEFTTDIINANPNAFRGRSALFATGVLAGQGGVISEFLPATGKITVMAAFTGAPGVGDVLVIS
jgi:hypothetical protein